MVARWRGAVVRRPLLAMALPSEKRTSSMVTKRLYCDYLGKARCSNEIWPHARWRGGKSTAARTIVFHTSEATVHGNVMP